MDVFIEKYLKIQNYLTAAVSGVDGGHCSCQQQCLVNIIRISHDTDLVTSVSGRRRHIIDTDHVMDIIQYSDVVSDDDVS